jgi:hypothetical protein
VVVVPLRRGRQHLLAEGGVPVVLDLIVCSPRQPPGDQRPPTGVK